MHYEPTNSVLFLKNKKTDVFLKAYFNIICMSWTINMGIVSLSSLILHMGLQDQDKTQDKLHKHHEIHVQTEETRKETKQIQTISYNYSK